jgi:hypothetical protein
MSREDSSMNQQDSYDFSSPILRSPKAQKPENQETRTPRLFLREPGWRVALKVGSDRLFCYMTNPGEKHYHRIMDGEIHLIRDDEKICLPCAERRGLLSYKPKALNDPEPVIQFLMDQIEEDQLLISLSWDEGDPNDSVIAD